MKIFDMAGLTYLDTETLKVGINPDIGLLDLIKLTHPEKYAAIPNKDNFLNDIYGVNNLLQEIYLRDSELRWQTAENIAAIDNLVEKMPHLNPFPGQISKEIDIMVFPGTTGVLMSSIAATARESIINGTKINTIAVLGSMQEWQQEWVQQVKTIFELRPDLLRKDINLKSINFEKKYTEHDVNALITQIIDFGNSNIHFEFMPIPMRKSNDGRMTNPTSNDSAKIFYDYYIKVKQKMQKNPEVVLVSTKGFHVRQSYSFLESGICNINVLMSDPTILGHACCDKFSQLVKPNTRAKLDNLARTIYQTVQVLNLIHPGLNFSVDKNQSTISGNSFSLVNNFNTENNTQIQQSEEAKYNFIKNKF